MTTKIPFLAIAAVAALFAVVGSTAAAADITLPSPQKTGGPALFAAIDARASAPGGGFPTAAVPLEDLSTILWAASGLNRDGSKWTVPLAMGKPPYCKIYVGTADGAYLYDWKNHKLVQVAAENVIPTLATQGFAKQVATSLYFVGDGAGLGEMSPPLSTEGGPLLAGAMSQDVYLACGGLGVAARLIYSFDREAAREKLKLAPADQPYFTIPLGKK